MISTDKYFQGEQRKYPFFEGWYFKQQIEKDVYAFIPGYSVGKDGMKYPFIQVINHEHSEMFYFEPQDLWIKEDQLFVKIGTNVFSEKGLSLSLKGPNLTIQGTITFGDFTVLNKSTYSPSIMGPFSYPSFMECYHGILSMRHSLKGTLDGMEKSLILRTVLVIWKKIGAVLFQLRISGRNVISLRLPKRIFSFLQQKSPLWVAAF